MRTEEDCKPYERYLFSDSYFSDATISIWQNECVIRCKDKPKGAAYEKFLNWRCQANEIAVFTYYAYAEFNIPKSFDTIFHLDNPENFHFQKFQLTQSIYEAWLPLDMVIEGHKHLSVFTFDDLVPDILKTLYRETENFSSAPPKQKLLGFCNSQDFEEIRKRFYKRKALEQQYGENWHEYDAE